MRRENVSAGKIGGILRLFFGGGEFPLIGLDKTLGVINIPMLTAHVRRSVQAKRNESN
jgi:hypothetical protein